MFSLIRVFGVAGIFAVLLNLGILQAATADIDSSLLEGLKARSIGPATFSGRVSSVDVVLADTNIIYIGSASGGVWKTVDGGLTVRPVFDNEDVASIGAIAIDQSNPDVVWVGTGEGNVRNSVSVGGGLYKTVDGGRTWKMVGLKESERINRIAIDPTDPNTVYVAAMGTLWGPNETRGIYKTTDGGDSWERILYVDENTGATDIKLDPSNPDRLYAAMWEFRRWPSFFKSGGPGSSLYTSVDGGENWNKLEPEDGLPPGELGRAVFGISKSHPNIVYALVEAEKSVLLRSDNKGESWRVVNDSPNIAPRPFYYSELAVDPANPNHLYNVFTNVNESIDGGKTFTQLPSIGCCNYGNVLHIDNHTYWINDNNPDHQIVGNDGGVGISFDAGKTFRWINNLPLAQFYHIAVDNETPYNIYGGVQDNGSWRGPSEVWSPGGIQNHHWQEVSFADGFDTRPHVDDANRGYSMYQGGWLFRWNLKTGESDLIKPANPNADTKLRFSWNAALGMDPHNPDRVYFGSQFVHRSNDRGNTWEIISPDMTTNDPGLQTYTKSGGLTFDVTAAETHTTILVIAVSPLDENVIWVGTDDGRLHVTRDGGETWEMDLDDRARSLPEGALIPVIEPSPHDKSVAFVVFDDHRRGNKETYLYKAENFGRQMREIGTSGVSGYALSVRQDHVDPDLIFLGTEFGLWVTLDGGEDWTKWTAGIPTVGVRDLAIQKRENDLVVGTHGRGIYIIDDYSALRNLKTVEEGTNLALLSISDGIQYNQFQPQGGRFMGTNHFRGENASYGVGITFLAAGSNLPHPDAEIERLRSILKRQIDANETKAEDNALPASVKVEIASPSGEIFRSYTQEIHQGVNRIYWSMTADGIRPFQGSEDDDLPPGAAVVPGEYVIKLTYGEEKVSGQAKVKPDPRVSIPSSGYLARFQLSQYVLDLQKTQNSALESIFEARKEIGTLKSVVNKALDSKKDIDPADETPEQKVLTKIGEMEGRLNELEELFRLRPGVGQGIQSDAHTVGSAIGMALFHTMSSTGAPSATTRSFVENARHDLGQALEEVNAFMDGDIVSLREEFNALGLTLLAEFETIELPAKP